MKKFNNLRSKSRKGFTLIELLVTITIFVILTGIVLFSSNGFNNTILLKDLAYDVALTVQQAQSYGVNVNESQTTLNPFAPFGVYFNLNLNGADPPGSNKNFVFFTDTISKNSSNYYVSNGKYDADEVSQSCTTNDHECISRYTVGNGNYIKGICVSSNSTCSVSAQTGTQVTSGFTILFTRPNPNAVITIDGDNTHYNYADIQVASLNGATKDVIVNSIGLVYVQ